MQSQGSEEKSKIQFSESEKTYSLQECVDLLNYYPDSQPNEFLKCLQRKGLLQGPQVYFVKTDPRAVTPAMGTPDSTGFDLTAISVFKRIDDRTALYNTHIRVKPPRGYYTEILPRSSISKSGYMLANSVGVIDADYRGDLLIALTKINEKAPDLQLPLKICQLIMRKREEFAMVEVEALDDTERGAGGFGSTDMPKSS